MELRNIAYVNIYCNTCKIVFVSKCPGHIFRIKDKHFMISVPDGKLSPILFHCPICEKRDLWLVEEV